MAVLGHDRPTRGVERLLQAHVGAACLPARMAWRIERLERYPIKPRSAFGGFPHIVCAAMLDRVGIDA